jgi:hypothetical protein
MRAAPLFLLLLWQAAPGNEPPLARPEAMRYERAIRVPAGAGQACAVLDGQIFPHAAASLRDLRVFSLQDGAGQDGAGQGGAAREVPYAITLSEAVTEETEPARVLNLGIDQAGMSSPGAGANIVFDLEMPDRPYTEVALDLAGEDFLATATVSGMEALGGGKATALGVFTLFDLSSQHLSRYTTLGLQESAFRYLHVALRVSPAPGAASPGPAAGAARFGAAMVEGAEVPPSREAQTVYTTVASVAAPTTGRSAAPRKTRYDLALPLRVPVERVSFDLAPSYAGNFSRDVTIKATSSSTTATTATAGVPVETLSGAIFRVHSTQAGRRIDERQLSLPATLGSNLQSPGRVWIEVENGDDRPLPIARVRLEMRQRKLCFDAPADPGLTLFYGDPALPAPVYDYARLFAAADKPLLAELGPEVVNAGFKPPPEERRPFSERHPEMLWIALLGVVCVLGVVALKSSRNVGG